jgi:hypothetical protein
MFSDPRIFRAGLLALLILAGTANGLAVASGSGSGESAPVRPDPEDRATRVSVGIYLVDIAEIDDAKQTFTADVYVVFHWKDARLAAEESARRILPLTSVWHPALLIINQRSVNRLVSEVVSVDRQGNVEHSERYQGTFSVSLNLRNFPLDEQNFAVWIVNPSLSPKELELVADERSGRANEFSIIDWAIGQPTNRADALVTPDGREIASFVCTFTGRRRAGAYVYQFVIPLTFIVCMSWAPFWMAPDQLGPRQGIAVTSMLTVITYRFVLANQLPRVAYLTRFDILLLGCTALVFLVLAEVVAAHGFMTRQRPRQARRLDVWSRVVFPALFLIVVVGASVL